MLHLLEPPADRVQRNAGFERVVFGASSEHPEMGYLQEHAKSLPTRYETLSLSEKVQPCEREVQHSRPTVGSFHRCSDAFHRHCSGGTRREVFARGRTAVLRCHAR